MPSFLRRLHSCRQAWGNSRCAAATAPAHTAVSRRSEIAPDQVHRLLRQQTTAVITAAIPDTTRDPITNLRIANSPFSSVQQAAALLAHSIDLIVFLLNDGGDLFCLATLNLPITEIGDDPAQEAGKRQDHH